jgi:alpha-ketoglutarate-dependent taurine dioxygenase
MVAALWEHHLLLVRGQELSAADLVAFARWFGDIRPPDRLVHPDLDDGASYSYLSNVAERGTGGIAEVMRHQDFTWTVPLKAICLHAIEVPDVGGDTVFYNSERALELLDEPLRTQLAPVRAVHFDRFAPARATQAAAPQEAEYPVIYTHPLTGRSLLFVNEQTTKTLVPVDGVDTTALLANVLAVFDDPRLQYVHHWQPGDVLIWDNLSLQHSRTAFAADQHRTLRRVQVD